MLVPKRIHEVLEIVNCGTRLSSVPLKDLATPQNLGQMLVGKSFAFFEEAILQDGIKTRFRLVERDVPRLALVIGVSAIVLEA